MPPSIYIFDGEDEFAIHEAVETLQAKLGDSTMLSMNTTRLDGRNASLDQLVNTISVVPFLADRRLVIVTNPLSMVKARSEPARQKFLGILAKSPPTTALVLIESEPLTDARDRRAGKIHWLERWAENAEERVYFRTFHNPVGAAMVEWVMKRAQKLKGQFSRQAAERLTDLLGDDPRRAHQEMLKLLEYVNYARPVEPDDVDFLTSSARSGDVFALVDAIGNRKGQLAQEMLHRLLKDTDAISIFGMIIRQFRLLLLTRAVLDAGGREMDIVRETGVKAFIAEKLSEQARHFSNTSLEAIYRHLLSLDEAIKTSQMEDEVALDTLVARLTA
jgi:DNA polymerase-3 subunit delta